MKQIFTLLAAVVLTASTYAQVGIGTTNPNTSAALDITSTTKGLLPPRMTTDERDLITSAAKGLIVFNTTLNTLQINEGDATTANWVSLTSTSPTYTVNTFYPALGGYVIEVNSDGTHGLVVAMQDQGISSWYEANELLSNPSNHDTDGKEFLDWRIPTKRELNLMYVVYTNGNGAFFNIHYYWSSREYDSNGAWKQRFGDNAQSYDFKDNAYYVRAVRAF